MPKNFFDFPWNQRSASLGSDFCHIVKSSCEFRKWKEKAIEKQDHNQKQPCICYLKLNVDNVFDEITQRFGGEYVDRNLPLELPVVTFGVRDSITEKVGEWESKGIAFLLVDREVGLEDVLNHSRVGCHNLAEGGRGRVLENIRSELGAAMLVGYDLGGTSFVEAGDEDGVLKMDLLAFRLMKRKKTSNKERLN